MWVEQYYYPEGQPPYTNRGVVITVENTDKIVIDWLSWTCKKFEDVKDLLDYFNFASMDFSELPKGQFGYLKSLMSTDTKIRINYKGTEDMGINVIISGSSCRLLEGIGFDLIELLLLIVANEFTITRLDIALDLQKKKKKKIVKKYDKYEYVSKFKSTKKIENKKGNISDGVTLYFGSRTSGIMLRIYDKQAEQKTEYHWTRIEFEIKKEYTEDIAQLIEEKGLGDTFKGLLNNYLNFVVRREKNVSRSKVCNWWKKLIDDIDKIKLYKEPKVKTVEELKIWIKKQVSPSLATVVQSDLGFDFITEVLQDGARRMKDKHYNML